MAEDPVADFLAREQNDLAGIDDTGFDQNFEQADAPANNFGDGMNMNGDIGAEFEQPSMEDFQQADEFVPDENTEFPASVLAQQSILSKPKVEPEKIKKWREDQKNRLEEKDVAEEKEQEKWRENAKRELADWYKNRAEQMEKLKKQNRIAEEELIRERDVEQPGQEWERITRLCEFNPKAAKNQKDISRYRSLLLQLKQGKAGTPEE